MDIKRTIALGRSWLSRLWAGEIPLARAFWLYGVLVFLAANDVVTQLDEVTGHGLAAVATVAIDAVCALDIVYALIWSVGVWRSGNKYRGPGVWRYLAYTAAIFEMIAAVHGLALVIQLHLA